MVLCEYRKSARLGKTFPTVSRFSAPATGTSNSDQKRVSMEIIIVMVHDLAMRCGLDRYVFRHTTSTGAGLGLARSWSGRGSSTACCAICLIQELAKSECLIHLVNMGTHTTCDTVHCNKCKRSRLKISFPQRLYLVIKCS